jgi:hypothetical protein
MHKESFASFFSFMELFVGMTVASFTEGGGLFVSA